MRFMDPNATVMIHDVSSMEKGKVEEIKASAEETDRLNKVVYENIKLEENSMQNCKMFMSFFAECNINKVIFDNSNLLLSKFINNDISQTSMKDIKDVCILFKNNKGQYLDNWENYA